MVALRRDLLCPQRAAHGGILPPPPRRIPTVIAKTRADSVMVHVTATFRLAPTHSFLESIPTKVSNAGTENSENSSQRRPRRKCPEGAISEGRDGKFLMPNSEAPHSPPGKPHIFGPQSRFNQPFSEIGLGISI